MCLIIHNKELKNDIIELFQYMRIRNDRDTYISVQSVTKTYIIQLLKNYIPNIK